MIVTHEQAAALLDAHKSLVEKSKHGWTVVGAAEAIDVTFYVAALRAGHAAYWLREAGTHFTAVGAGIAAVAAGIGE